MSEASNRRRRPDLHAAPYLDDERRILTVQEIRVVEGYMDELEGLLRSCDAALEAVGGELEVALSRQHDARLA
jgi:hypothetical protein